MKHALSSLSLAAAITLAFTGSANAANGMITISGMITDTTCDISVNNGANDAIVTLPTVSTSVLTAAGNTAGSVPFSIALTNCGTGSSKASTWFESGESVDNASGRLNNTAGSAANVQVELLNKDLMPIRAGGTAGSQSAAAANNDVAVDISQGSGTLNYYARYYATGAATAGTVMSRVQYTIVYQ